MKVEITQDRIGWYDVYEAIASVLSELYDEYREATGLRIFEGCSASEEFIKENFWFDKFLNTEEVVSLDPIHLFSSFSANNMDDFRRINRIQLLVNILNNVSPTSSSYDDNSSFARKLDDIGTIDFQGCPAPPQIHSLSLRKIESQNEIWKAFSEAFKNKQNCDLELLFRQMKNWYGIDVKLFTMFLFWIRPKSFIPLDRNTASLLIKNKKIDKIIRKHNDYKNLLEKEDSNLYKSISLISYSSKNYELLTIEEKEAVNRYFSKAGKDQIERIDNHFRLLAIKPKKGCHIDLTKALKLEELYKLHNNVIFNDEDGRVIKLNEEFRLYDKNNFSLNFTSVAGKNGTGKSTIAELFIAAFNNIAFKTFKDNPAKKPLNHKLTWIENLNVEFYFETDSLYKVRLRGQLIEMFSYDKVNDSFEINSEASTQTSILDSFFYTTLINYSLHGLNTLDYGPWLYSLFHKNDGYQTPVVIEPFREDGVIDINRQDELVKHRLVYNLLLPDNDDSYRVLKMAGKKKYRAEYLKFKNNMIKFRFKNLNVIKATYRRKIIFALVKAFDVEDHFLKYYQKDKWYLARICKYILNKIYRLLINFSKDYPYYNQTNRAVIDITELALEIRSDQSHRVAKIRRTLNFIKFGLYERDKWKNLNIQNTSVEIEQILTDTRADDLPKRIDSEKHEFLLPPSFLEVNIYIESGIKFNHLSSGEKQILFSLHSLLYHLRNVDSVNNNENNYNYSFFNVFLDEIELCFHPEYQRIYLDRLRKMIHLFSNDSGSISGVNICFITHSPFVLSDIPESSILLLDHEKGNELRTIGVKSDLKTFGANIHDLLSNGFFMKSTLGKFSESCLMDIIDFYRITKLTLNNDDLEPEELKKQKDDLIQKYNDNIDKFEYVSSNIADEAIHGIVKNHLKDITSLLAPKVTPVESFDREIAQKEHELENLKKMRNQLNA